MFIEECYECRSRNYDLYVTTESEFSWEQISSRMTSYQKNLPKSLSKLADASRKITNPSNLSFLSNLSLRSNNAYKIFASPEDELAFSQNSLDKFKADEQSTHNNRLWMFGRKFGDALFELYCSDSLQKAVTALYAKVLIILGLALPLSEVISANIAPEYFQLFYVYLFLGSLLYLIFVYIDLLQERLGITIISLYFQKLI